MGEFEIPLQLLLTEPFVIDESLTDRLGCLTGDSGEHGQILLAEVPTDIAGIELQHSDHLPSSPHHGNAHHRTDAAVDHALVGAETAVG